MTEACARHGIDCMHALFSSEVQSKKWGWRVDRHPRISSRNLGDQLIAAIIAEV